MNALILGSTGLVGHELLELLVVDTRFEKIDLLSRRELDIREISVTNHLVDFTNLLELPVHHSVDILFIAFGSTIKKAGSRAAQWEIDVDIPTTVMKHAKEMGVKQCVLISALGVSLNSPFFYSRMKAQLDENAKAIGFEKLIIVKPSVLEGPRPEKRTGEKLSIQIGNAIGKTGLINKYRPVEAINVAKCMIQTVIDLPIGYHEIPSNEIVDFARKYTKQELKA
ncbi:MAG: hypothetical protein RI922_123 [Bacteroidota bacterium]|jgi:uncharacterized protein YbjT (DUF2867 family)